jgi:hypothetical protein
MDSDVPIGKLRVRDLTDIATGVKVPNIYIDTKLSDFDPPPPSRLERLLRHPVKTTKNALANRLGRRAVNQPALRNSISVK